MLHADDGKWVAQKGMKTFISFQGHTIDSVIYFSIQSLVFGTLTNFPLCSEPIAET